MCVYSSISMKQYIDGCLENSGLYGSIGWGGGGGT